MKDIEIIATHKNEIITASQTIEPQGANSIWFENIGALGDATATLDGNIPVAPGNSTRDFYVNTDPRVVLKNQISMKFGAGANKRLLVIRRYYEFKKC